MNITWILELGTWILDLGTFFLFIPNSHLFQSGLSLDSRAVITHHGANLREVFAPAKNNTKRYKSDSAW